jgi:tRNA (guanine-N7-)-methyltransferase
VSSILTVPTIFISTARWFNLTQDNITAKYTKPAKLNQGFPQIRVFGGSKFFPPMQIPSVTLSPAPSLIHPLTSIVTRLDLTGMFPGAQPLEVELGSGDGSFLVNYAKLHPGRNFLGVERLLGRLRKLDRKSRRADLLNLRGLRIESAYLLEYLLPAQSVSALHIYFPDPWPKRKHRKNRLINARFTELARQILTPGGTVYLRTDDEDYFRQMVEVFSANLTFDLTETPAELSAVVTDFERNFNARGVATRHAAYKLAG